MDDTLNYHVVTAGSVIDGFEHDSVLQTLMKVLKVSEQKAHALLTGEHILKRDVDAKTGNAFKAKLEGLGLSINLQPLPQEEASALGGLSLEPMPEESVALETQSSTESQAAGLSLEPADDMATESFDNNNEPVAAEGGPSVFEAQDLPQRDFHKPVNPPGSSDESDGEDEVYAYQEQASELSLQTLAACVIAAIAGAFVWRFVAVQFNLEHGVVAWLIGGAIGFAALSTGSQGDKTGGFCALLALFSILGGKYLAVSAIQTEAFDEMMALGGSEMIYEMQVAMAEEYAEIESDNDLVRIYMFDNGMTDEMYPEDIPLEEVEYFREEFGAELASFTDEYPSHESWIGAMEEEFQAEFSVWEVIKEDLNAIDIIFFLLGIVTAFRLGQQGAFS